MFKTIKKYIKDNSYNIYMYIPLPNQIKKCLKEIVFICCGNLFEGTTKYESWKLTRKHLFKRFFHIPMSIEKNFT